MRRSGHILVVDDTKILANSVAEMLRMEGYKVSVVYGGSEAIGFLKEIMPDLIITDLMMTGVSGYDLLRFVRHESQAPSTPVVVITANTNPEAAHNAGLAGASVFIIKPFDDEDLIQSIITLLAK